jgi:hypothetical protein
MSTLKAAVSFAALVSLSACQTDRIQGTRDADASRLGSVAAAYSFANSDWSEPVNLGAPVNSEFVEQNSALTDNGLTLYFQSSRPGGVGGNDLWVTHRASIVSPWEAPVNLGAVINSADAEGGPSLSRDGHLLFFQSLRPGGFGDRDIYVSRRLNRTDDFAWGPPQNLGPYVNTETSELAPEYVVVADGPAQLYFQRGLQAASQADIYATWISRNGEALADAVPVVELNVADFNDASPAVRADGREIIFSSNRLAGGGLFVSTRNNPHEPWSTPVALGGGMAGNANGPELSEDGRTLMFFSTRAGGVGGFDIWMVTRTPSGQ